MPQKLSALRIKEVSLVDRPANSSTDELTGEKIPHARVALFKADEVDKYHPDQQRDNGAWTDGGAAAASGIANALSLKAKKKEDHAAAGVAHEKASVAHRMAGIAAQQVGHDSAGKAHDQAAQIHDQKAIAHYQKALGIEEGIRKFVGADLDWDPLHDLCKAVEGKTIAGETFPKGDFAYIPDPESPSTWKLRIYTHGKPDARIVGAAVAALGKGFRGNKVSIPPDALPGVKAKVRSAWHAANPDAKDEDLPPILKNQNGENMAALTMQEVEKKLQDQSKALESLDVLKAEQEFLVKVNEEILKMSKKERKAFGSMTAEKRKEYMAGDEKKRAAMMKEAEDAMCTKRLTERFDTETLAKFEKAGPAERQLMLTDELKKEEAEIAKKEKEAAAKEKAGKKKAFPPPKDNEDGDDDDPEEEEEKSDMKKVDALVAKRLTEELAKRDSVTKGQIATLTDAIAKQTHQLAEVTKRERMLTFQKMADAEIPHLSGTSVEKAEMLFKMADAMGGETTELFKTFLKAQKDADRIVALGFREIGKDGGEQVPALKALEGKAQEIAKRDNLTPAKAMEKACEENYDLYRDYERAQKQAAAVI